MDKYDKAATKVLRLERQISEIMAETVADNLSPGQRSKIQDLERGIAKAKEEQREALIEGAESGEYDSWNVDDGLRSGRRDERIWDEPITGRTSASEVRARALSAIERMGHANDALRAHATDLVENHDDRRGTIARLAAMTSNPVYVSAFENIVRSPQNTMLSEREIQAVRQVNEEARAMSLTDAAGGFLVPFALDPSVIISSAGSTNAVRQVARKVTATGDSWNGVSSAAVSWSWDGEGVEASDDATVFSQPSIAIHKAVGFVPISIEAMQDEANVAGEVGRLLAFGKETLESAAFVTGSGSGEPTGIITALTGTASEINAVTGGSFNLDDVYALDEAIPDRHRANASWLANRAIFNDVRQFTVGGGADVWERLQNDQPPLLLGAPAYTASDMSSTITTGERSLLVGNFDEYVIADRIGTTIEFVPHLFATGNNRPSGQRGWFAYYRVGADSVLDDAFRLLVL